jgi:hypothetical protein
MVSPFQTARTNGMPAREASIANRLLPNLLFDRFLMCDVPVVQGFLAFSKNA